MSSLTSVVFFQILITYCSCDPKVFIIGAGAAGLAAATKLLENGVNVQILEAEPKIGGRIHTVDFAELGAQHCILQRNNVVYSMVKDLNLLQTTPMTIDILTTDKKLYEDGIFYKARDIFIEVFKNLDKTMKAQDVNNNFNKQYKDAVLKKFPENEKKQKAALSLLEDLKDILSFLPASNFYTWKNGYKIFLDVLMKNYPDKIIDFKTKILPRKIVETINWGEEKIIINLKGGGAVKADYVIFTPSIGVLKENHKQMFVPNLPEHKIKAIKSINFSGSVVFHMHFLEVWWPKTDFPGYHVFWKEGDKEMISEEFKIGPFKDGKSWLTNLHPVQGNPNVLQMWFYGELGLEIEKLDEQMIIDGIDFLLKKFVPPTTTVIKADKILMSDWNSNPHFKGTHATPTTESYEMKNPSCFDSLIEPLTRNGKPIVMFAGEGTNPQNCSSVPGAVESGWREAERLLKLIQKEEST